MFANFCVFVFPIQDLKTSRGLLDEMKKTANNNAKQVRPLGFFIPVTRQG